MKQCDLRRGAIRNDVQIGATIHLQPIHVRAPPCVLTPEKAAGPANAPTSTSLRRNQYKSTGKTNFPGPRPTFRLAPTPWQDCLVLTLVLLRRVIVSAFVPVRHDEDDNDHREGPEQSFVAAVLAAAAGPPSACHGRSGKNEHG